MNNQNFENTTIEDETIEAKKIKSLQQRINSLEAELITADDNFNENQKNTESIKKELNESQVTLSQIEELLDKLKINEAGAYNLLVADFKYIKNLLYEIRN